MHQNITSIYSKINPYTIMKFSSNIFTHYPPFLRSNFLSPPFLFQMTFSFLKTTEDPLLTSFLITFTPDADCWFSLGNKSPDVDGSSILWSSGRETDLSCFWNNICVNFLRNSIAVGLEDGFFSSNALLSRFCCLLSIIF